MRTTITQFAEMKARGEPIGMVTAYDFTTARIVDSVGFPAILVGDSASQVMLGYEDTVPLTMEESLHHVRSVVRGTSQAHVIADMPFMSYAAEWPEAVRNAGRFLKEGGAQSVKVEGGARLARAVGRMVAAGIPVMGHLGLTPQSVNQIGGYRLQATSAQEARTLMADAIALEEAGAYSIVLELVPAEVAREVTARLSIPTIGIGAGPHCDGQIQVLHDLLGLFEVFVPKHTRRYATMAYDMRIALGNYLGDVRAGNFPGESETHHAADGVAQAMEFRSPKGSS